jgi:hypothetical protein
MVGTPTKGFSYASPFTCAVSADFPTPMRSEGFTELAADLLIKCTGGTPTPAGTPIPMADILVFFNTNATSRVYARSTEAVMLIDEPGSPKNPNQLACHLAEGCTVLGTAVGGQPGPEPFDGRSTRPNIFAGRLDDIRANAIIFRVPVDPPGAAFRTFRIKNVRVNASGIGFTTTGPGQVVAFVTSIAGVPPANPQQVVGFVDKSIRIELLCDASTASPMSTASLQFKELFPSAFKTRTTESGYYNPSLIGPLNLFSSAGLADSGTRLAVRFSNIAQTTDVWVSATNRDGNVNQQARFVVTDANGGTLPVPAEPVISPTGFVKLPVVFGTAIAVWEVLAADPQTVQTYTFAIGLTRNVPTYTDALTVTQAPFFPGGSAERAGGSSLPIPRFLMSTAALSFCSPSSGVPGDVNGDAVVNCTDLAMVKTNFGKRIGQPGFDSRADVVKDGIIDVRDMAYVSQRLPARTRCP